MVLNGVGFIGRTVPPYIADLIGPMNIFIPTAFVAGICGLAWMAVTSTAGLYVWAVFYGITAGGVQGLFPACLSILTTDLSKAGVRMGMVFTINSIATLTGPPIAGAIINKMNGRYEGAQTFAGAVLLVGMGFFIAARIAKTRKLGGGAWIVKV
jgi:MFS family permease